MLHFWILNLPASRQVECGMTKRNCKAVSLGAGRMHRTRPAPSYLVKKNEKIHSFFAILEYLLHFHQEEFLFRLLLLVSFQEEQILHLLRHEILVQLHRFRKYQSSIR